MLHWAYKNKRDDVIKTIVKLGTEVKDDVRIEFVYHFYDIYCIVDAVGTNFTSLCCSVWQS